MSDSHDTNFDGLAERFAHKIYGNLKGELRLDIAWHDIQQHIPAELSAQPLGRLNNRPNSQQLKVWDAGGGLGQMSQLFYQQGHQVLLTDISQDMLDLAPAASPRLQKHCGALQETAMAHPEQFDVVVCHAVLEWLADPQQALKQLYASLKPGGYLSLMFYNIHALVMTNLIKGNYNKLTEEQYKGDAGGFTPQNPQDPTQVLQQLQQLGFEVLGRRGVRVAYDLLRKPLQSQRTKAAILEMEWKFSDQEPYWQMGRYVHVVCRKH